MLASPRSVESLGIRQMSVVVESGFRLQAEFHPAFAAIPPQAATDASCLWLLSVVESQRAFKLQEIKAKTNQSRLACKELVQNWAML